MDVTFVVPKLSGLRSILKRGICKRVIGEGGRAFLVCLELVLSFPIRAYPSGALAAEAADQKRERMMQYRR